MSCGDWFFSEDLCACGSVTDCEFDVLGRTTKIIHPLVLGEQERAEYEVVYDDVNGTVTPFNENDEKTIRYYDGLNRMVKEERREIHIFFKKGEDGFNMTFAELFHTMGHEMEHAKHYISGIYFIWEDEYTPEGAVALSESEAYRWNLLMLPIISFPGAVEMFSSEWLKHITEFQKYL
ncbi:MAG: hypothetical protein WBA22_11500 [Candidatus Methanofastidiosia archaeon]